MKTTTISLVLTWVLFTLVGTGSAPSFAEDIPPLDIESFIMSDGLLDVTALVASGYEGGVNFPGYRLAPLKDVTAITNKSNSPDKISGDENWFGDFPTPFITSVYDACLWNEDLVVATGDEVYVWDGTAWLPINIRTNGWISDVFVYDNDLIISGDFTIAGGIVANRIVRFDGSQWHSFGYGMDNYVKALGTYGGQLVVGGEFQVAGTGYANKIASWNGNDWIALGDGLLGEDCNVKDLIEFQGQLIVGGSFHSAGSTIVNHIAAWNGSSWASMQNGTSGSIYTLAIHDGALIAGGYFTTAGLTDAYGVAAWNGAEWSALGGGVGSGYNVGLVESIQGVLYASTNSMDNGLMRWEDGNWVAAASDIESETTFLVDYNGLVTMGIYYSQDSSTVYTLNGNNWDPLYGNGLTGEINASVFYKNNLIVAGDFWQAGEILANGIALWDGTNWHTLGSGLPAGTEASIKTMTVHGDSLIVGGWFESIGGISAINIACWDGVSWGPMGDGLGSSGNYSEEVRTLVSHQGYLFAGGDFDNSGSNTIYALSVWDGASWVNLGTSYYAEVNDLEPFETGIAVGGYRILGDRSIALLDENGLSAIGDEFNIRVNCLAVYNGNLVAAFTSSSYPILSWDGSLWTGIATANEEWYNYYDMEVYQDRLIIAGNFHQINGIRTKGIAAWDGLTWDNLGSGLGLNYDSNAHTLTITNWGLAVGGGFKSAGGKTMCNLALWSESDCNNNGIVDGIEIANNPGLDMNNDGILDSCQPGIADIPSGNTQQAVLHSPCPNPFNPSTTIAFDLPAPAMANLYIYNISGRLVQTLMSNFPAQQGRNEIIWNGRDATGRQASSGMYFYQLEVDGITETKKMVLIK